MIVNSCSFLHVWIKNKSWKKQVPNKSDINLYSSLSIKMFKCTLQASRLYKLNSWASWLSPIAAHIHLYIKNTLKWFNKPYIITITFLLFTIDKCRFFKSYDRGSRCLAYSLVSISEKTQRSNHLQMLGQRQNILLNYFKTLRTGPAGNRTRATRKVDWYLTT